MEVVH